MDQLYIRHFSRLAQFFQNMAVQADLIEDLINDTMYEVCSDRTSKGVNASALLTIMRFAYCRAQKHFAGAKPREPLSGTSSRLQFFLSRLPVEERAAVHLVYAGGWSRRETADIMKIGCDHLDALLRRVCTRAKVHLVPALAITETS